MTKPATAALLATGMLALSHCANGPATNMNAANLRPLPQSRSQPGDG